METNKIFFDKMKSEIAKISSNIENLKQEIPNASIERNKQIQKELKKYQTKMQKIQKVLEKLLSEKKSEGGEESERMIRMKMINEAIAYMVMKFSMPSMGVGMKYAKGKKDFLRFKNFWYRNPSFFTNAPDNAGDFKFLISTESYPDYENVSPFILDFSKAFPGFQEDYKKWRGSFTGTNYLPQDELTYRLSFIASRYGDFYSPGDLTYWRWLSFYFFSLSEESKSVLRTKKLIFPGTLFRDDLGRMCVMSMKFYKRSGGGRDDINHQIIPITDAIKVDDYQYVLFEN